MSLIKRNLRWLLISQISTWGMSVLVLLVVPRKLGDAGFGRLSFAMVYVSFFELVALFGTGTYLMKVIARDATVLGRYVFNTLVLKVLMTTLLIVIALGLAWLLGYTSETILLIGTFCLGMLFNALNNALAGGLQGVQQMGRPALWDVARSYAGGAVALAVVYNGGSVVACGLAFNVACAIPLMANAVYLLPQLRGHGHLDFGLWRRILGGGVPFFVMSALLVVYGTIDIPMLQAFSGSEAVGWYALAYRWVSMPAFFAVAVSTAFFPALSAQSLLAPAEFARMANRSLHLALLVSTPAAVGIGLIADDFLSRLYGDSFRESVPLMRVLAIHLPIVAMDIVLGSVLVAVDRQRKWVYVGVAAAVFNPLLNLVAIPLTERLYDNGAIGAASVTVFTELILMVGAIYLRPAGVLDKATTRVLLRIVLATTAMVPVVLVLDSAPVEIRILAGVIAYGLASLVLRTVSIDDLRASTQSVGRSQPQTSVAP